MGFSHFPMTQAICSWHTQYVSMPFSYHCVSVYYTPEWNVLRPNSASWNPFLSFQAQNNWCITRKSPQWDTYTSIYIYNCAWSSLQSTSSKMFGFSNYVMQTYLPHGMWDLSSLTRDQTCIPCIGRQIPHHWTTGKVPSVDLTGLSLAFQSHNVPPSHHSLPWGMASCVHTFLFC